MAEKKNDGASGEKLMDAVMCKSGLANSADENDRFIHRVDFEKFILQELPSVIDSEEQLPKPTEATNWEEYKKLGLSSEYCNHPEVRGRNVLTPPPERHPCLVFLDHQTGMFSLLLWAGSLLCFIAYGVDPTGMDNLYLGVVLAFVVFFTGVFSFVQERKSNAVMDQFKKLAPPAVTVRRDGKVTKVEAKDVCVGDLVFCVAGDKLPADLRMVNVTNMKVEQSSLTGEPDAIPKNERDFHENPLESKNLAFFGTSVEDGKGMGMAVLIGDNTIMGNIAQMASAGDAVQTPINKEIHRFILIVSAVAFVLGISFLIIGLSMGVFSIVQNLVFMIGIIVANVPEGLLATVTVSLTLTAKRLGTKAVKVKDLEGVETLGSTTCICSDKTGTLTQNLMTASYMYLEMSNPSQGCELEHLYNVRSMTSSSGTNVPAATPSWNNMQDPALTYILYGCNVVNSSEFVSEEANMKKPIQERDCTNGNASDFGYAKWAEAVLRAQSGISIESTKDVPLHLAQRQDMFTLMTLEEDRAKEAEPMLVSVPFNSRYKCMISVNMVMDPVQQRIRPAVIMKGAAEQIFQRCSHFVSGGEFKPMTDAKVHEFLSVYDKLADDGERLISFCMKYLDEDDQGFDYKPYDKADQLRSELNGTDKVDVIDKLGGLIRSPTGYFDANPNETEREHANWENAANWFKANRGSAQWQKLDTRGDPGLANYPIGSAQYKAWNGVAGKDGVLPATPAWDGMVFIGLVSLVDPPREAVPPSIMKCHEAGVKVVMVTGDHPQTAEAIARNVNIIREGAETKRSYAKKSMLIAQGKMSQDALERYVPMPAEIVNAELKVREEWAEQVNAFPEDDFTEDNKPENAHKRVSRSHLEAKVVPGHELKNLTDQEVQFAFMYRDLVFARTSPEQKLKIVNNAQAMGHVVAVTGDGVNDSPALKGADIGCAMGIAGTEVSKEAADMILLTDDFSAIVMGIEEGRVIFDNLKKSIAYTLSSNIPEISPFLMFILIQMPLSLTTVLILCVDLGTDMIPAISLAYERAESDIMRRPPRDSQTDHLVTAKLVSFAYLQIGVFQALAGFYSFFVVMNDYGFRMSDIPGAALYVNAFPADGNKIHDECPCGGGAKAKFMESKYIAKIKNGRLDETSTEYQNLVDKLGSEEAVQALCPAGTLGALHDGDWPFTWGCEFGALKPMKDCKFKHEKYMGENPCFKGQEALRHAQTAAFISIVIVQWADLLICKTRILSIYHQGMNNNFMLFGLFTETLLCSALAYLPAVRYGLNTRDVLFVHWLPSCPYSILIFLYDETRKFLIRRHRKQEYPQGIDGPRNGNYQVGWLEKYTYY